MKRRIKKNREKIVQLPVYNKIHSFIFKVLFYFNFISDFNKFKKTTTKNKNRFPLNWHNRSPHLYDNIDYIPFDPHYIYHPAWAARVLAKTKPDAHIDISSLLSFATTISAFIPTKFYDYRHPNVNLNSLTADNTDLLNLPFEDLSVKSLSCMHVIEHLGLGRYGDTVDPDSDLKAINELKRVLSPGGNLLIVVPTGKPVLKFNAHRIYSYNQIISYFSELKLKEFVLITDNQDYYTGNGHKSNDNITKQQNFGCGCFWFQKNN